VKCSHFAQRACTADRDGSLKIVPEVFEDNWFQWLENIQDWCVSRQLWWAIAFQLTEYSSSSPPVKSLQKKSGSLAELAKKRFQERQL
jgi:valyl-tRNA synthetase